MANVEPRRRTARRPPGGRALVFSLVLVVLGGALVAAGADAPLRTMASIAATVTVLWRCVPRDYGPLEGAGLAAGAVVAVLALVGVALGATPLGLGRVSWAVALTLVGVGALLASRRRPSRSPMRLPPVSRLTSCCVALGLLLVAAATTYAISVARETDAHPLELAVATQTGTTAVVVIRSGRLMHGLSLVQGSHAPLQVLVPDATVGPGQSLRVTVHVVAGERLRLRLVTGPRRQLLRQLTLQVAAP